MKQKQQHIVQSDVTIDEHGAEHHPSYGMVSMSHVSSTRTPMVGSRAYHTRLICFEVGRGRVYRGENDGHTFDEHWMEDSGIVRAYMTYSQFAELISSMNQGSGVPCTLSFVMGERMAEPPRPESFAARFKKRVMEATGSMRDKAKSLLEFVTDIRDENRSVKKSDLAHIVDLANSLVQQTESNVPFVMRQAEEVLTDMTQKARDEINHMANRAIYERGLGDIFEGSPVQLPEESEQRQLGDGK